MDKYLVEYNNEILGTGSHIMNKYEISNYNKCALRLSDLVDIDKESHSEGMWTVSLYD